MNNQTQTINPDKANNGANNSKKENLGRAAAAGIGAVAGAAAGYAAAAATQGTEPEPEVIDEEILEEEPLEEELVEEEVIDVVDADPEPAPAPQPQHSQAASNHTSSQASNSNTTSAQPQHTSATQQPAQDNDDVVVEDDVNIDPIDETVVEENVEEEIVEETVPETNVDDVQIEDEVIVGVNPDDIAEAVISEEQVDPNDLETADVFNFESVDTVYTVGGEAYTAASFHDESGQELLMVDVDADDIFDVVTTLEGDTVAYIDNLGITVADAELSATSDDPNYLASTDIPGADDSYLDDIITV